MGKYGISTDVYQTYREEFHGMTAPTVQGQLPTHLVLQGGMHRLSRCARYQEAMRILHLPLPGKSREDLRQVPRGSW